MEAVLTLRQQAVLEFLKRYLDEQGFPPSLREIAHHFKMADPKGAKKHLDALVRKGIIQRLPGRSRAIRIAGTPVPKGRLLPILGTVRAGLPLLSEENIDGQLWVDPAIAPGEAAFLLRVKGESMIGAHIMEGDYVVVQKRPMVQNGEIAVVLVDGETTLKYFSKKQGVVILSPAHPQMRPIVIEKDRSVEVLGKVIAVVRMYDAGSQRKKER
ncbi:MAG: repressor LexA [Nitrospirae bacterium]|nr:repressor LexA [Candidatus Manganitrophaceae bacterium]